MRKKLTTLTLAALAAVTLFFVSCDDDDSNNSQNIAMVTANRTSISFGNLELNEVSAAEQVEIAAISLTEDVTITVPSGFLASFSEDSGFSTDELTIAKSALEAGLQYFYVKAAPEDNFKGSLGGYLEIKSTSALGTVISLTATVGLEIEGDLFMSEYFEQYVGWSNTLPLDYGILGWNQNKADIYADAATLNAAYADLGVTFPASTVPNNEVYNTWYLNIPLNGLTLRGSLGISDASSQSFSSYPTVTGARDIELDPSDESQYWTWINKNNGKCGAAQADGNNTSAGRRFAADGYADDVFMSALINVSVLGSNKEGSTDLLGAGDIIALANATSGSANNNTIKIVAIGDGSGGFNFGLLKENEGNPYVLSSESYSLNTTYAVVLSHEFVDGDNNDVSKLYVFKEGETIPTTTDGLTPVATIDATYTAGVDPTDLTIVFLRERRQSVINPTAQITGIRVGNTWIATLFQSHEKATNSNDLTENGRVLVNTGSSCTP